MPRLYEATAITTGAPSRSLRLDEQRPMEPLSFRVVEPFPAK